MRRALIAATTTASLVLASGTALAATSSGHNDHARAAAEAKAILAKAPVLAGSHVTHTAPARALKDAPDSVGEIGLVTLGKYWVITGSAKAVYDQLTATTPSGFTNTGGGSEGNRSGTTLRFTDDELNTLPSGIASGDLMLAVAPLKNGKVGIGAYGEAAAQPRRPAAENVPTTVTTASLSWTLSMSDRHPLTRSVSGATGSRLVKAFNALPVDISGPIACPLDLGGTQSATFVGGGHTWVATLGSCGGVYVVRDGKEQRTLSVSERFYRLMHHDLGIDGPKRHKAEDVSSAVHRVRIVRTAASGKSTSRTVHGSRAGWVVEGFNGLQPVRKGVLHCTAAGATVTATFAGKHHTWVATEDPCELVSVTRDGKAQPTLAENGMWIQSLR